MYEYVHGGDIYTARKQIPHQEILDFSANINPLGLPPGVKEAALAAMEECCHYPDPFCRELTRALTEYEAVPEEGIFCANGASEIIFRLALALKPKKALLLAPTFADYEKALRTVDCELCYYHLAAEHDFALQEDFLDRISRDLDMVWICNPNNPTGQGCAKEFLLKVLDRCRDTGTLLLMDECFMAFVDEAENYSVQDLIGSHNSHLLVLKAFTKVFAMPGLRLGYLLTANPLIIEKLRQSGQDWSVSVVAQKAGIRALGEQAYLERSRAVVSEERQFLLRELELLGIKTYGSLANYIFFQIPEHPRLDQELLPKGILIRSCANYKGLSEGYFRIAVKKREENQKLIESLREILNSEERGNR